MTVLLLKLLLLLFFLVLLFLVVRVLEGVAWYETGLVISQIMDPLSLSVRKLKVLLDGRGISYDGVVEKQELTALMQASGDVMEGELLLLEQEEEETEQSTSFISGPHFYEEVEDKKDSIWLIQITPRGNVPVLERETWKMVVKKVSRFGIRTGTFDCAHDNRFCRQKGWTKPVLMLAMPRGLDQKDSVVMAAYPSANHKASKVVNWVSARLASTVHRINEGRLVKEWLEASQNKVSKPPVRLMLLSEAEDVEAPLFFSAISLKYSGRVQVGQAFIQKSTQNWLFEKFKIESRSSQYLVTTPESIISYGAHDGEYLNHRAMDIYLRTLYPQANDFFMLSFVIGNMLCVLELTMNTGDVLAKRMCNFLWVWVKYNAVLIMLWLPLLALTQIPFLDPMFQFCQKALRVSSQTTLASQLRCMWVLHSHQGGLIIMSFFVFCAVIGYVQSRCSNEDNTEGGASSSQWLQSTAIYYYNMLVRPSPGYTRVLMSNARLEEGVNYWDRLRHQSMFPNLFLLAGISQDYLKDLPMWRYRQQEAPDECSSTENCTRCSRWKACFPNNRKYHRENCRHLQEYFRDRDKKLKEYKVCGKYGNRGEKGQCRKCLCRYANDPKRGKPFLVTNSQEISDSSPKMAPKACPDFPVLPENIGSATSGVCQMNLETDALVPNLELSPIEKSCHETKLRDKESAETPNSDEKLNAPKRMCDCGSELEPSANLGPGVKSTFDSWPEGMMDSVECSICLEPYVQGVVLCGLPCGHAFHQGCVMEWLTTNRNHCCPNCRWPAYETKGSKMPKHKE